ARPTAEINGAWGGHTGPGFKTVIPAEAHAKVSFRLVAGQDPARILRLFSDFVRANTPEGIRIEIRPEGDGVRPCATAIEHPANQALVRAMRRAFDREPLFTREGGSGPEADLVDVLQAPIVFLGMGLPDDGFHAPNERVRLRFLDKGAEVAAYLWSELVDLPRG
ncbi:MAG: M20/M25/M40 family metallo-hydrolase, partial [Terriglobales bacterium]